MRNAQKQEVLGCIGSLHQAHEEIKKALEEGNYISVQNMLSECQEFAVSLGENIEKLEGEGHAAVACLEGYCETLYHVYGELDSASVNSSKVYKKLRKQLLRVESSARNDIRVKKEVVFLPYKASMWDSLESVWKAADEDPDCDAYVIPIPYYDKNPDGSFGEMHYEAAQYPEYVSVVQYKEYDFEKRRPDIIFIHNPYDECNYVTSVLPFFYSKNLKRFTEKLVYIPYFILGEIKPDDRQAVEGMKKFCMVPGVMNADKVIVQSEDMRLVYINVLAEAFGEDTRGYWEKKILGLGSPKVDKVLNTRKEDLEIPEEWLQIIRKPDGSWKKIIFYNTSVTALLEHDEKMLEKMQDVFRVFQENKDEVALLWRPHPLIRATLESMRPLLWKKYDAIVRNYKEEEWGIYDDSSDIDRAMVLSDAYYGDPSSVVQLYQQTGKQMLIQRVKTVRNQQIISSCDCIITKENVCWYEMNSIVLQDIEHEKGTGTAYAWLYTGEYVAACEADGKIYFAPMAGSIVRILDLHTREMKDIELFQDEHINIFNKFVHAKRYGDSIYFLPGKYPYILEYSLKNKQMQRYALDLVVMNAHLNETLMFYESSYIYDGKIYLASANNGVICSFDTKVKTRNYFHIAVNEGFTSVCGFQNKLYLADVEGNILKVIIGNDKMQSQKILENKELHFRKSIAWNGKIIMFMEEREKYVLINPLNDDCEIITLFQPVTKGYNRNVCGEPKLLSDKLYIYNKLRKTVLIFDKNMTVQEYEISDIKKIKPEIVTDYGAGTAIYENNNIEINSLEYYLKKNQDSSRQGTVAKDEETVGTKIEKAIKG